MTVFLIGAGGHAKVVIATLQAQGHDVGGIYDDDPLKRGTNLLGIPILGSYDAIPDLGNVIVCIGNNAIRKKVAEKIAHKCSFVTAIHPYSVVHSSVQIGAGSVVFAGSIIQPDSVIGAHCIVNTATSVDHDGRLEAYVQICPGTHLAGNVWLEEGVFCGTGSTVIPNLKIGAWTVVGAGSTVIQNILPHQKVVGVPARSI